MNLNEVKKQVLNKIKPMIKEEKKVKEFTHKILDIIEDLGHEAVVVGSTGKHTWLKGDHDIDIFVLFPKETSREELEKKGLEIGEIVCKRIKTKPIKKYAEHPYTQTNKEDFKIDIVPCYKINEGEKPISAVDRSPLHLRYVIENLKPEQRDEVRLLKQFLKGTGLYGSDVKHLGFSGYVCELLIIKYETFESIIREAANWKFPQIVDMDKEIIKNKKLQGAMFLSDPVDKERNAAAAINTENLMKFISYAKSFSSKSDVKTFFSEIVPLSNSQTNKLKTRETVFLALFSKRPDIINDTLFPQLRKATHRLENMLKYEDFHILNTIEYADNNYILILFEFDRFLLPNIKKMIGPPIYSEIHTKEFLSKYKNPEFGPMLIENRWFVEIKRKYRTPEAVLKEFLKYSEKELIEKGIPNHVVKPIKSSKILKDKQLWNMVKKNKKLSDYIRRRYFEPIKLD